MDDTMKKIEICEFCGSDFAKTCEEGSYIGNNCFDCSFWMKKIEMPDEDEDRRVIVDGDHYRIGIDETGPFRGFGGREFTILFQDGRRVKTKNLWCQGEIPERFRKWFPDNAVFVPVKTVPVLTASDDGIPF